MKISSINWLYLAISFLPSSIGSKPETIESFVREIVKSHFFVCFYNSSDDPRLHLYDHKVMSFTIPIAAFTPSNKNAVFFATSYFAFLQFIWRSSLRQATYFELIDSLIVRGKKNEEEIKLQNLLEPELKRGLFKIVHFFPENWKKYYTYYPRYIQYVKKIYFYAYHQLWNRYWHIFENNWRLPLKKSGYFLQWKNADIINWGEKIIMPTSIMFYSYILLRQLAYYDEGNYPNRVITVLSKPKSRSQ